MKMEKQWWDTPLSDLFKWKRNKGVYNIENLMLTVRLLREELHEVKDSVNELNNNTVISYELYPDIDLPWQCRPDNFPTRGGIPTKEAVQKIMDHLDLELKYTPGSTIDPNTVLKKKEKKEVNNKDTE